MILLRFQAFDIQIEGSSFSQLNYISTIRRNHLFLQNLNNLNIFIFFYRRKLMQAELPESPEMQ